MQHHSSKSKREDAPYRHRTNTFIHKATVGGITFKMKLAADGTQRLSTADGDGTAVQSAGTWSRAILKFHKENAGWLAAVAKKKKWGNN